VFETIQRILSVPLEIKPCRIPSVPTALYPKSRTLRIVGALFSAHNRLVSCFGANEKGTAIPHNVS